MTYEEFLQAIKNLTKKGSSSETKSVLCLPQEQEGSTGTSNSSDQDLILL